MNGRIIRYKNFLVPPVILLAVGLAILANAPLRLPYNPNSELAVAVGHNDVKEVEAVIARGADVNARDKGGGWTALHFASATGNFEMMKLLVQKGASVNVSGNKGETPLIVSHYFGDPETVKFLISKGANVNAVDSSGKTLLHYYIDSKILREDKAMTKLLLDSGTDPTIKDRDGFSVYDNAKKWDHPDLIQMIESHMKKK